MDIDLENLPDDKEELKKLLKNTHKEVQEITDRYEEQLRHERAKYREMEEKFLLFQSKLFGRKSEKLSKEDKEQGYLFNEAEMGAESDDETADPDGSQAEKKVQVKSYQREKSGRKPIPAHIPRKDNIYDLSEAEKKCKCCGNKRPLIGNEVRSEKLDIIPAEIFVVRNIVKKYGACKCRKSVEIGEKAILSAKPPKSILPGSIATPGLLAYILVCKFTDALPFYRQEKIFNRGDVPVSRANMCNWTIKVSSVCRGLIDLMWEKVISGNFIQMDETTIQVIKETRASPNQKNYMWVTVGYSDESPIILYHYHPRRDKSVPQTVLKG